MFAYRPSTLCIIQDMRSSHCGLRYTKKLTGSDFISNIKKVYLCTVGDNDDFLYIENIRKQQQNQQKFILCVRTVMAWNWSPC